MKKVGHLSPVVSLATLIRNFTEARAAWEIVSTCEGDSDEWAAYEACGLSVVEYPCKSLDDVREKAAFFLESDDGVESLANDSITKGKLFIALFLQSLLGGEITVPAMSGDNGAKQ
ncbi:hypothetical protein [Pararhizobium sp. DWP1-1-3]|uniref:hypothetical protein n=1 Tax=Pararhizobium sp. DWP1-1-3 TaxID=2804652 RepID=UPI003CF7FC58